ncbi:MAG: 3-keto-5-aminohexanoate cleavage protein [Alphaproteobacteria bacterium]|nr:3-keto-5-aminohexanoate cleavage protein [Alphaproteobacteria bacterium]
MEKLIIEARVNEYAMRRHNRHVPWTSEEIARDAAACREAGASIVHFHAREENGAPCHDAARYAETIARVHDVCDLLVHPTLGANTLSASKEGRLAHVLAMARDKRTRPDFAPMDMGSTNIDAFDPVARRFVTTDQMYLNSTDTLMYFAKEISVAGLKPAAVVWNLTYLRQAMLFHEMGLLDDPVYLGLTLTEGKIHAGHPATEAGLDAFLNNMPKTVPIIWTVYNYGGSLLTLADKIIASGGHVAVGLGDHPYTELGEPENAAVISKFADIARKHGRGVASPAEARKILRMP